MGPAKQHGEAGPRAGRRQAAQHGRIVLPLWPHKASDGQPVEREISAFPVEELHQSRRQAKAELLDLHFEQAGNDKVTELVDEHHEREHGHEDQE